MLTTWTGKHTMVECEERRIHTLSHSQSSEPAREERLALPSSHQRSGARLQEKPLLRDGPKRRPTKTPDRRRDNGAKRRLPMTICAGALCKYQDKDAVVVISDRMMTSGDIEYPGPCPKIFPLPSSPSSLCLSADWIDVARMVVDETRRCLVATPINDIAAVARLYADNYANLRKRRAEQTLLSHLGLDADSFVARQNEFNQEIARDLEAAMADYDLRVESIIAGVDSSGPHIYQVENPGVETCLDHSGFASIGSGSRQFETLFMSSGYHPGWELNQTLFLAYSAKKRAEVSPGVGSDTDIRICTSNGIGHVEPGLIVGLERLYQEYENARQVAWRQALGNVHITVIGQQESTKD
jgi:20S proteasome alpha/beta subunit